MNNVNSILRRSAMVDVSGAYDPPAIQATIQQRMGGGVYTDGNGSDGNSEAILTGRISLGFVALIVIGAVAFYLWTHEIQGGG